jgi:aminoglycoside 6'-N-acetyltransferase I
MRHALWPDAELHELQADVEAFFAGSSRYITAAFIAYDNDKAIGFIEINVRPYAEGCESSPVPHIEAWYVAAQSRRTGIGTKLMRAAEQWALAHGFTELTSDTNDSYPLSVRAHAANGFAEVERLICFRKKLR